MVRIVITHVLNDEHWGLEDMIRSLHRRRAKEATIRKRIMDVIEEDLMSLLDERAGAVWQIDWSIQKEKK